MNNDRGQSLHIPSITPLKENNIYVATLHSVIQKDFSGEVKHQFTYETIRLYMRIVIFQHKQELIRYRSKIGLNVIATIACVIKRMNLTLTVSI